MELTECLENIKQHQSFRDLEENPPPSTPGIYCFYYTNDRFRFPQFDKFLSASSHEHLLYIGISKNLNMRDFKNHFNGSSSDSTLRRSIGALFRADGWNIDVNPKGAGKNGVYNYHFDKQCETRLSDWMKKSLKFSFWENHDHAWNKKYEPVLIKKLKPVLNILHSPNSVAAHKIRELRRDCIKEAREKRDVK